MGIDLGGTKILGLVLGAGGRVLARVKTKTRAEDGYRAVVDRVADLCREALADSGRAPTGVAWRSRGRWTPAGS